MTDHKFTDDDVIKALECCACGDGCEDCPRSKQCDGVEHLQNAVDLINRQKAEIERLQRLGASATRRMVNARAEAIKAFAHFLIDKSTDGTISIADLPDLVIEMTEVSNG